MTPIVYNLSIGVGVALVAIGSGAQWGWPIGVMSAGAMVIGLTLVALRVAVGR